jgi:class 3 adenylate cyclase
MSAVKTPVISSATFGVPSDASKAFPERLFAVWKIDSNREIRRGSMKDLFGPAPEIRSSFSKIGSIELVNTSVIQPVWQEENTGWLLPHLSLSFAKKVELNGDILHLDDSVLFLDRFGRIPVNFIHRDVAFKNFLPVSRFFRHGSSAKGLESINEGDVVLVLPSMYAGNTDFKNTPVGRMEGGIYHMSVINSVLTRSAIRPALEDPKIFLSSLIVLAFLTSYLALGVKIRRSIFIILAGALGIAAAGIAGFAYGSVQFDWHILTSFILVNGSALISLRIVKEDKQIRQIESALEGMVPEAVLKSVMNQPELVRQRPNELNLTVMFVDIEGFSLRTKTMLPADVFRILHAQIGQISSVVHAHGGVVDRILGDGIMAYFGYNFDPDGAANQHDHAYRALLCAVEIQRECVHMINSLTDQQSFSGTYIPLRIGLNTGDSFLGNLGSGKRIDLTIVGHTVNLAKRLEDACDTFRVLLSSSTYDRIKDLGLLNKFENISLRPRYMSVKHEDQLFMAWECDPFSTSPEFYEKAIRRQKIIDNSPDAEQTPLFARLTVQINAKTEGTLISLSENSASIQSQTYFCRKVFLNVELCPSSEACRQRLLQENLKIIYMQVLKGSALGKNQYMHHLRIIHLTQDRMQTLLRILSEDEVGR